MWNLPRRFQVGRSFLLQRLPTARVQDAEIIVNAPTIRCELAAAVRAINVAYNDLPASVQAGIDVYMDGIEAEIDAAVKAGDRDRALSAIRAWQSYWLDRFERAAR